jgi:hypothetical protein
MKLKSLNFSLLKLRCRNRLLRGGTLTLKNGLTVSIANSNLAKFNFVREAFARKCRRFEKLIKDASFVAQINMKLYNNLADLRQENYRKTCIATFNIPTPTYAVIHDSKLESFIEQLASMRLAEALSLCDVIAFNNAIISNQDANVMLIAKAIKDKLPLPMMPLSL